MKKLITFLLVLILAASPLSLVASCYDSIPAPDWVTVNLNRDASKTLTIKTPTYMIDKVDYYEYSTDGFLTVQTLSNKEGGEFVFDETVEFSLRYYSTGIMSETYTVNVVISKVTVITDHSTNISIVIPFESPIPTDISLAAYEITGGTSFTAAENAVGENRSFRLFSVSVMRNNKEYKTDVPYTYLFPCGDFISKYSEIHTMDSRGNITLIESAPDMNMRLCETDKTGFFLVIEDKTYRSGDLNGDGEIQANDARLALRIAAKLDVPSEQQIISGDINKNGETDAADARLILRAAASLENID